MNTNDFAKELMKFKPMPVKVVGAHDKNDPHDFFSAFLFDCGEKARVICPGFPDIADSIVEEVPWDTIMPPDWTPSLRLKDIDTTEGNVKRDVETRQGI